MIHQVSTYDGSLGDRLLGTSLVVVEMFHVVISLRIYCTRQPVQLSRRGYTHTHQNKKEMSKLNLENCSPKLFLFCRSVCLMQKKRESVFFLSVMGLKVLVAGCFVRLSRKFSWEFDIKENLFFW